MRAAPALAALLLLAGPAPAQEAAPPDPAELSRKADAVLPGLEAPACAIGEKECAAGLLRAARDLDQAVRRGFMGCMRTAPAEAESCRKAVGDVLDRTDAAATGLLKRVLAAHGWPGGPGWDGDARSTAWLLAQHADRDRPFQRQALDLLRKAADEGRAKPSHYAYLHDRLAGADQGPQRYGTQGTCRDGAWAPDPLEDPARVDELRASVGLEPLAAYAAKLSGRCPPR
ncbi:MAG TPA: DUF6624 domain-containing protein [Azospirillaceae bacterium]|nr:DUF6624 domain-containing protein [Azospirillaceae bacterium]